MDEGPRESKRADHTPEEDVNQGEEIRDRRNLGGSIEFDDKEPDEGSFGGDGILPKILPRLRGLEQDFENLSTTVSTLDGKHSSIRETVDAIENDVRMLVEIHEHLVKGRYPIAQKSGEISDIGVPRNSSKEEHKPQGSQKDDLQSLFDDETDAESVDDGWKDGGAMSFQDEKSEFELIAENGPENAPAPGAEGWMHLDVEAPSGVRSSDDKDEPGDDWVTSTATPNERPGKPYLTTLPTGFGAEILLMDWLDFLVRRTSPSGACQALRYYRTIDWITNEVAEELQNILAGVHDLRTRGTPTEGHSNNLSIDDHAQSLEFISQIRSMSESDSRRMGKPDSTIDEF